MTDHDGSQIVRGPDGRWGLAEQGQRDDGHRAPDPPPSRTPGPAAEPAHGPPGATGDAARRSGPLTGLIVRRVLLAAADGGEEHHVVIRGDAGQPATLLKAELARIAGPGRTVLRGGQPLPEDGVVGDLDLTNGERLLMAASPDALGPVTSPRRTAGPVLRLVGGPDAGRTIPLDGREHIIGSGREADIRLRDPRVAPAHARVRATAEGVVLTDLGTGGITWVEGAPQDHVLLEPGDILRLGDSLLEAGAADDVEVLTPQRRDGVVGIHRRFRTGMPDPSTTITLPRRRSVGDPPPLNLVLAVVPALGLVGIALLTSPRLLLFAVLSPLIAVTRALVARREHRRKAAEAGAEHEGQMRSFARELELLRSAERTRARRAHPDLARIREAATRPTRDLHSRRSTDADGLTVRVGVAHTPSDVTVDVPAGADAPPLPTMQAWQPVAVSLVHAGGLALVGPLDRVRPLAAGLLAQLVVLHATSELELVVLAGADGQDAWSWTAWLPHVRGGRHDPSVRIGADATSRAIRVEELRRELTRRRELGPDRAITELPRLLVVYDDVSARLSEGVAEVLREGASVGLHALCLDVAQVPEGCNASVSLGAGHDDARVEVIGHPTRTGVLIDSVAPSWCADVGRALSPVVVIGEDDGQALPASARLLDVIGLRPTAAEVAERWAASSPSARAIIGVSGEGPLAIDLTRDGPHALVAGTTGSGKSEFLKTLIASLAVENSPEDLALLFVDFKGGNDFQTLSRLPHAVGLTTNLDDPAAFARTLQLLEAEMGRRVRVLGDAGVSSIESHASARAASGIAGGPHEPLPRLLVVVDEFAELKGKAPEQLDRLVSIARTGRAVGVHLVLATQRPAGVVTSQIDANVGLRVCFRVNDEQESKEILGSPLAGRIAESHRGRCFISSAATPLTEVQTARVAGARPGSMAAQPIRAIVQTWETFGRGQLAGPTVGEVPERETDLHDVVQAAIGAAEDGGWGGRPGIPWPGELPAHVPLSRISARPRTTADALRIPIGVVDDPASQRRELAVVQLGAGHVVVAGSARTGRTTTLRCFIAGLLRLQQPDDVQLHTIDFGGGSLQAVSQAAHSAGIAVEDLSAAEAVIDALERELGRRRELFSANGWPDLPAQRRTAADPLPWLVLVIDGWDNLQDEGQRQQIPSRVAALLARGGPQGLVVVMAGDRGTSNGTISRHLTHRYVLRFNRALEAELQGLSAKQLPSHQPPGRAIEASTGRLVQLAVLDDPDDVGQPQAFARLMAAAAPARRGGVAAHTPSGTSVETSSSAVEASGGPVTTPDASARPRRPSSVPAVPDPPADAALPVLLGIDEEGRARWADLADVGGITFAFGPPGSGRSTTLAVIGAVAADLGIDLAVLAPPSSPLASPAAGVTVLSAPVDADAVAPAPGRRLLVLVDDLDQMDDGREMAGLLGTEVPGRGVVVAADISWARMRFSGLAAAARRGRRGLLLSPPSTANGMEMFEGSLRPDLVAPLEPGRGVVDLGAGPAAVRVPAIPVGEVFPTVGEESPTAGE